MTEMLINSNLFLMIYKKKGDVDDKDIFKKTK